MVHAELALRPLLLHAFGGLTVSLDTECLRPPSNFLAGYDLVLQSVSQDSRELSAGQAASVAFHPFWKTVILQLMKVCIGQAKRLCTLTSSLHCWPCSLKQTMLLPR